VPYTPTDPARPWIVDENGHRSCHSCAGTGAAFYLDRYGEPYQAAGQCPLCRGTGTRYVPTSQRDSSTGR
jgi:DnaJ-class molecular chaperone